MRKKKEKGEGKKVTQGAVISWISTLAAAEDNVKVTDTSLRLALSQWLDVETTLLSAASNGLLSGNAKRKCSNSSFVSWHFKNIHFCKAKIK